jgi:glucose-1-phosphate adenylyltransferase
MDYEVMLQQHVNSGADVTVGCLEVPRMEATGFGVMHVDQDSRIIEFLEKPADPPSMPDNPDVSLASMGIYVFRTEFLINELERDANDPASDHDFGKNIIPYLVKHGKAVAHRFPTSCVRSGEEFSPEPYWRDVGTIDAYWQANIDLTDFTPALDLYDREWPIWTYAEVTPPAKFIHDEEARRGMAISSMVSGGCIISGSKIHQSLLFTGVHSHSFSELEQVVALPDARINRNARLKKVVIDRGVEIPEGLVVGEDPEDDARRFRRSEGGVCLITQPMLDRLKG